jgi:peroxiredoxin
MPRFIAISFLMLATAVHGQEFKLGSKVDNFQVRSLDGKPVSFAELRGSITVVTFISVQCPVSNAYNERMNAVYNDYGAKGVKFIFVNANRSESPGEVAAHAKRVGFAFPVYKDPENALADRFDAQVTPESYVIDSQGILRYHGSIDDQQNESRVRQRRLRAALDEVLAGKDVQAKETKAFGCTIKRVRKAT